jgi:UDP-4-amino-4,6-dideoxy-N-acetyl-beta-L-altrosamine transaminase
MIPYGRHHITEEDIESVTTVLKSDFLTSGPLVPKFESQICKVTKSSFSTAVNSCTSGLHIACKAIGLKAGDILWTSPISFVASASCGLFCGAKVDFIDIDEETALLSIPKLINKLEEAERNHSLPKVIIPVHFAGQPCDMKDIYDLSKKYGFKIIEDAAHALGAYYDGQPVGSCVYSDITVFSLHPVKIITSGEGGIATTNDLNLQKKMQLFRSHGVERDVKKMRNSPDGPWSYEIEEYGFNYRMTDIAAALGISQLKKLNEFVRKRKLISDTYDKEFLKTSIKFLKQKSNRYSSHHLYVIKINSDKRNEFFSILKSAGIGVQVHYIPIYKFDLFDSRDNYPSSERYYKECITIPLYAELSKNEIEFVIDTINSVEF